MSSDEKNSFQGALETFFIESREGLQELESTLLKIEKGDVDRENLNLIFRIIHTIKGSSGMFGLLVIEEFTHRLENILDDVRNERKTIDFLLLSIIMDCKDHIQILVDAFEENPDYTLNGELLEYHDQLMEQLHAYIGGFNLKDDGNAIAEVFEKKPVS